MVDVLCGIFLVGIGYYLGTQKKPPTAAKRMTEKEERENRKAKEQWEMILNFSGRRGNNNE